MSLRRLIVLAMLTALIGGRAYANDAMTILQEMSTKWQTAYNAGEAAKVADLFFADGAFISGVLGTLRSRADIEKAVADQMKKAPKITITPTQAWQSGGVVWGYGDFMYPNGPSGYYGFTMIGTSGVWHIAMYISNVTPPK